MKSVVLEDEKTKGRIAHTFSELFSGNKSCYGVHQYGENLNNKRKRVGKSWTEKTQVTSALYNDHLNGKRGLGIIPIDEGNKCSFVAIDIDIYEEQSYISKICTIINKYNLPISPFLSKSSGVHLYLFFKRTISAKKAIEKGHQVARLFDMPYELFPKQASLGSGAKGNWINLPYYGGFQGGKLGRGVDIETEASLDIRTALAIAQENKTSISELDSFIDALPFSDGPPCLQRISILGGPVEGGRNTFLFNSGIYFKQKDPAELDQALYELNDGLNSSVDSTELKTVISSLSKKDYLYTCDKEPICSVCDKSACLDKKYGVGFRSESLDSEIELGVLTVLVGQGKSYTWEVRKSSQRALLHFNSHKDLLTQDVFVEEILKEFNYKVSKLKTDKWDRLLNSALSDAVIEEVNVDDDYTKQGQLLKVVLKYFSTSATASVDDVLQGMVLKREKRNDLLFRSEHLWRYLTTVNKLEVSNSEYRSLLKTLLGSHTVHKISSKSVRLVRVPLNHVESLLGNKIDIQAYDVEWDKLDREDDF